MNDTKRISILLIIVLLLLPAGTPAAQDLSPEWKWMITRLQHGAIHDNPQEVREAASFFEDVQSGPLPADMVSLAQYTVAYADYQLSVMPEVPPAEQKRRLDQAQAILEQLTESDVSFAEAYALLATVYGIEIGRSGLKGMFLGHKSSSAMERAAKLEPNNPRVVMQEGIGAFFTPKIFGGGQAKAEALLRRASVLFDREPPDHAWPNWGRAEVHVWLGLVLAKRGDKASAREEYQRALAIAPDLEWVRRVLLPQLATMK